MSHGVRVEVADEVGSGLSSDAMAMLVEAVLSAEGRQGCISVALVGEAAIAGLNRRYRGRSGATDVLSFAEEETGDRWPEPPDASGGDEDAVVCPSLGEMIICPAVVSRYAQEEGSSLERQLAWTIIHGTLHLLGYDHERDQGEMRRREQQLLERLSEAGLLMASGSAPGRQAEDARS